MKQKSTRLAFEERNTEPGMEKGEKTLHHRINFLQPARLPRSQFSAAVPGVRPRALSPLFSIPGSVLRSSKARRVDFCFADAHPFPAGRLAQGATHEAFQY